MIFIFPQQHNDSDTTIIRVYRCRRRYMIPKDHNNVYFMTKWLSNENGRYGPEAMLTNWNLSAKGWVLWNSQWTLSWQNDKNGSLTLQYSLLLLYSMLRLHSIYYYYCIVCSDDSTVLTITIIQYALMTPQYSLLLLYNMIWLHHAHNYYYTMFLY